MTCAKAFARLVVGLATLASLAALTGGLVTLSVALGAAPDKIFDSFEGTCDVSRVVQRRQTNGDKCFDTTSFSFCTPDGACGWSSRPLKVEACDTPCSNSACVREVTPKFAVNQSVPCWKPKPGVAVPEIYACGNASTCYKIIDPKEEQSKRIETSRGLAIGFGVIFLLCSPLCCHLNRRREKPSPPQAPMPHGACSLPGTSCSQAGCAGMAMAEPAVPVALAYPMQTQVPMATPIAVGGQQPLRPHGYGQQPVAMATPMGKTVA